MSKLLKCSSCNIVINEVLAFISNKIEVMDEESLGRLCVTGFSENDIKLAKDLLFESISTAKRKKIRKRQGKALRDIDDIICVLKELRPEEIPVFVARELHKLPPVTFDHVDVTRLLKDNLKMRYDIDYLKEECVSKRQLEELKLEIENLKKASIVNNFQSKVNYKRGACLVDSFEYDSGPMGLPPAHIEQDISINHHLSSKNVCRYRPIIEGSVESLTPTQTMNVSKSDVDAGSADKPVADRDTCDALMTHDVCLSPEPAPPRHTAGPNQTDLCEIKTLTSSELLPEGESTSEEGKWIPVQNRKRNRFAAKRGSAVVGDSTNFKAAATKVAIYIYNVSKATTRELHSDVLSTLVE
ncbi:uncharacterized protein LOC128670888 [Plodia interpunctella]|uniref:uncharacterized protein LOC128670888 n=1 Tax=Plodia interpunctella TaxID=58824 RepID=UPI0023683B7D|nr:uncharacterized protein LOC128670888 [Plodia interpunctella]